MNLRTSSRRARGRSAIGVLAALVFAALPGGGAEAAVLGDTLPPLPDGIALGLQQAEPFLEAPSGPTPDLPAEPNLALIDVIGSLSKEMGRAVDPTLPVVNAALAPEVAGNIALVLHDMLRCQRITKAHVAAIGPSVLKEAVKENGNGGGLNPSDFNDIRPCAQALWKSANHLQKAVTDTLLAAGGDLDVWPVIRYDRSKADNTYRHDYALLIDAGGDDTYDNNAGSNAIDVNYGPPGQPGLRQLGENPPGESAKGCARAVAGIVNLDCIPAVSVLLDLAGKDRYGKRQTPTVDHEDKGDANCTPDLVVRRMLTNGVGFLGVGILIDGAGDDVYTGKTVSNGSGHLFGVGVLHDQAGNDTYLAVRNSTGFGLVGGLGVFRDYAGNDVHDFYMPSALDPAAPDQTEGAGGVIDDEDACDTRPRYNLGGGNVAATGLAVDDAGNDTYIGGFSPKFQAPGELLEHFAGGSLGFGANGGTGVLVDAAGTDSYDVVILDQSKHNDGTWVRTAYTEHPDYPKYGVHEPRKNGGSLLPSLGDPEKPSVQTDGETGTGGVFHDK